MSCTMHNMPSISRLQPDTILLEGKLNRALSVTIGVQAKKIQQNAAAELCQAHFELVAVEQLSQINDINDDTSEANFKRKDANKRCKLGQ